MFYGYVNSITQTHTPFSLFYLRYMTQKNLTFLQPTVQMIRKYPTSGITFWRWSMYLQLIRGVMVLQTILMPSFSSGMLQGLCLSLRKFFMEPHTFSIGFKSGLSAGLFYQLILLFSKKVWMYRLVCLGSLSWYSLCPSGYVILRNWTREADRMSPYLVAVITPSNMMSCVAPLFAIPTHTGIFGRCLYLYLSFLGGLFCSKTVRCTKPFHVFSVFQTDFL